jgi:hypothetical protein
MRYVRTMDVPAGAGQACVVLDAAIFPHALPSLTDVRIFPLAGGGDAAAAHEVPYAITLSEAASEETQAAKVLNLGAGAGGQIVFDLEMPGRAYTEVSLDLAGKDFVATATVTGMDSLGAREGGTALGAFTLFDLSSQRLSRDTTMRLEESAFRYLHVGLRVAAAPGAGAAANTARFGPAMVEGAEVPPSREADSVYTTVAETSAIATVGRESHASFTVAARVPIERVTFVLAPGFKGNFSREVRVTAMEMAATDVGANAPAENDDSGRLPLPESVSGTVLRVHASEGGREISTEQLGVAAILGANLQRAAKVDVAIENGDDVPLPIAAVRLEMRQRKLCFEAPAGGGASSGAGLALYYGDATLTAPAYDYDLLFVPARKPLAAVLGPERVNPEYRPLAAEERPVTERHPGVLWVAVIGVICGLGVVALRAARNVGR